MWSSLAQFLFCVFSALLCAEMSMARDFDSAMRAYENKDYSTALKEFTAVAVQGNQEAQLIVGKMYMIGQGVEKDSEQAIKWFKVAAGQGNADAQFFRKRPAKTVLTYTRLTSRRLRSVRYSRCGHYAGTSTVLRRTTFQGRSSPIRLIG